MEKGIPIPPAPPPTDKPGELTAEYIGALIVLAQTKTYPVIAEPYYSQLLAAARLWFERGAGNIPLKPRAGQ